MELGILAPEKATEPGFLALGGMVAQLGKDVKPSNLFPSPIHCPADIFRANTLLLPFPAPFFGRVHRFSLYSLRSRPNRAPSHFTIVFPSFIRPTG